MTYYLIYLLDPYKLTIPIIIQLKQKSINISSKCHSPRLWWNLLLIFHKLILKINNNQIVDSISIGWKEVFILSISNIFITTTDYLVDFHYNAEVCMYTIFILAECEVFFCFSILYTFINTHIYIYIKYKLKCYTWFPSLS